MSSYSCKFHLIWLYILFLFVHDNLRCQAPAPCQFISCFSLVAVFYFRWAIPTQMKFMCIFAPESFPPFSILPLLLSLYNSYLYLDAYVYSYFSATAFSDYPSSNEMLVHSTLNNIFSQDIWANNDSLLLLLLCLTPESILLLTQKANCRKRPLITYSPLKKKLYIDDDLKSSEWFEELEF